VADNLARTKLARAAAQLNAAAKLPRVLPSLAFLTDDDRLGDPLAAMSALPRGSLVILRARDPQRRAELAAATATIATARLHIWLIADDPELALRMRASGVHFPEKHIARAAHWRARRPHWLITCAAHSSISCASAGRSGADAVFVAPVFATASHPERATLGPLRLRLIAQRVRIPIYALGGVDAQTASRLKDAPLAGLAAVGALAA
jgi:thiamine-phosphate pyrophosphorylase